MKNICGYFSIHALCAGTAICYTLTTAVSRLPDIRKELHEMRNKSVLILTVILLCISLWGTALADYGYTNVSDIPMAVDFTFSVDFDENGQPHVVTDYPFETTGATEMNLVYGNEEYPEALTLNYKHSTGITRIGSRDGRLGDYAPEELYRMIRDGKFTLDNSVYLNTSHFSRETDWVLVYAVRSRNYTEYTERTYAQAFNAMGSGGVEKSVYYQAGGIDSTRMVKRISDADLVVEYDAYGEITYASITRYGTDVVSYDYDPYTGLFGGLPITELGYDETDLAMEPLAFLGTRTEMVVAVDPALVADKPETGSAAVFAGSLLTGIIIGLVLIRKLRQRIREKKESSSPEHGSASGNEGTGGSTAEASSADEYTAGKYRSANK